MLNVLKVRFYHCTRNHERSGLQLGIRVLSKVKGREERNEKCTLVTCNQSALAWVEFEEAGLVYDRVYI